MLSITKWLIGIYDTIFGMKIEFVYRIYALSNYLSKLQKYLFIISVYEIV